MTTLTNVLVLGVDGYRRFGSPRTGPCPHRLRCGGRSCSAFGRAALSRHGAIVGLRLIRRRFRRCRHAAVAMAVTPGEGGPDSRKNRRGRRDVLDGTVLACCAVEAITSFVPCSS